MRTAHNHKDDRRISSLSDDSKMGILLMLIALLAFGGYAIMYLVGMAMDMA